MNLWNNLLHASVEQKLTLIGICVLLMLVVHFLPQLLKYRSGNLETDTVQEFPVPISDTRTYEMSQPEMKSNDDNEVNVQPAAKSTISLSKQIRGKLFGIIFGIAAVIIRFGFDVYAKENDYDLLRADVQGTLGTITTALWIWSMFQEDPDESHGLTNIALVVWALSLFA